MPLHVDSGPGPGLETLFLLELRYKPPSVCWLCQHASWRRLALRARRRWRGRCAPGACGEPDLRLTLRARQSAHGAPSRGRCAPVCRAGGRSRWLQLPPCATRSAPMAWALRVWAPAAARSPLRRAPRIPHREGRPRQETSPPRPTWHNRPTWHCEPQPASRDVPAKASVSLLATTINFINQVLVKVYLPGLATTIFLCVLLLRSPFRSPRPAPRTQTLRPWSQRYAAINIAMPGRPALPMRDNGTSFAITVAFSTTAVSASRRVRPIGHVAALSASAPPADSVGAPAPAPPTSSVGTPQLLLYQHLAFPYAQAWRHVASSTRGHITSHLVSS